MPSTPGSSYFLEYDPTGLSADNLVQTEYHAAASEQVVVLRCSYGAFFKTGFAIYWKDISNELFLMVEGDDYELAEFDAATSSKVGKEVYRAIRVTNPTLPGIYAVDYQALGGSDNPQINAIWNESTTNDSVSSPVEFDSIENIPEVFPPAPHLQDVKDVFGGEYLQTILTRLYSNLVSQQASYALTGAAPKDAEVTSRVMFFSTTLENSNAAIKTAIDNHIRNVSYLHTYTKAGCGLGNLSNGGFTALTDGSGSPLPIYASPAAVTTALTSIPSPLTTDHRTLTNDPHDVTAVQVGLGSVIDTDFYEAYAPGTNAYVSLLAGGAVKRYVTPYVAANAITEKFLANYNTNWTVPAATRTAPGGPIDLLEGRIATTQTQVAAAVSAVASATAAIEAAQVLVNEAIAANRKFAILEYNSLYAATLTAVMNYDYGRAAVGSSVSSDGFYPVANKLDNLELWLDFSHSANTYSLDGNGNNRLMRLVDRSANERVYSALNYAAAPIMAASQDIADGEVGFSVNQTAHFDTGTNLLQIFGPVLTLQAGMTIIAMIRTADDVLPLFLMQNSVASTNAEIVAQPEPGVALSVDCSVWTALQAAPGTINPNESTILVASVGKISEADSWFAACKPIPYTTYPRGTDTPAQTWPSDQFHSSQLNMIGSSSTSVQQSGEIAHLLVYNRQLSMVEVKTVVEYLRLSESRSLAFAVNYAAANAF